jgi:hypothetical protein
MTLLGSLYQWVLFEQFDITVFDFAELNDLLLAAFRDPLVLPQALVGFITLYLYRLFHNRPTSVRLKQAMLGSLILYTLVPPLSIGYQRAGSIKDGWGTYARVTLARFSDSASTSPDSVLMLLGTSESYMFFYEQSSKQKLLIPSANIAVMSLCKVSRGMQGLTDLRRHRRPERVCMP